MRCLRVGRQGVVLDGTVMQCRAGGSVLAIGVERVVYLRREFAKVLCNTFHLIGKLAALILIEHVELIDRWVY